MKFSHIENIQDFESEFITFYKKEVVYKNVKLSKEEFLYSLKVFYWFVKQNEFLDLREVCENTIAFMNNEDRQKLGLLHFLTAYVQNGDLDCTAFPSGISNNIPQMIRALSNTYKSLMKPQFHVSDLSVFSDLEKKFNSLENARGFVLSYIGRMGHRHLGELSACKYFHPSDVEEILYELILVADERTNSEKKELFQFIKNTIKSSELDLETDQNHMTFAIQDYLSAFETEQNNS